MGPLLDPAACGTASSSAVRVRLRHGLAQLPCDAAVTHRPGTVRLIAELTVDDRLVALRAPEGGRLLGDPPPCRRHDLAAGPWTSRVTGRPVREARPLFIARSSKYLTP